VQKIKRLIPKVKLFGNPFGSTETGIFTDWGSIDHLGPLLGPAVVKVK